MTENNIEYKAEATGSGGFVTSNPNPYEREYTPLIEEEDPETMISEREPFDAEAGHTKVGVYNPNQSTSFFDQLDQNYNTRLDKIHQLRIMAMSNPHADTPAFSKIFSMLDLEESRTNQMYKSESERMGANIYRNLPPGQKDIMGRMLQSGQVAPKDALHLLQEHISLDDRLSQLAVATSPDDPIRKQAKSQLFGTEDEPGLLERTPWGTTRVRAGVSPAIVDAVFEKYQTMLKPTTSRGGGASGGNQTAEDGLYDAPDTKNALALAKWESEHATLTKDGLLTAEAEERSLRAGAKLYATEEKNAILLSDRTKEEKEAAIAAIDNEISEDFRGFVSRREGARSQLRLRNELTRAFGDPTTLDVKRGEELAKSGEVHSLGFDWGRPDDKRSDAPILGGTLVNTGDGVPIPVPVAEEEEELFRTLIGPNSRYKWNNKRGFIRRGGVASQGVKPGLMGQTYFQSFEEDNDEWGTIRLPEMTEEQKRLDDFAQMFSARILSQRRKVLENEANKKAKEKRGTAFD
jgi:hypothetical protein